MNDIIKQIKTIRTSQIEVLMGLLDAVIMATDQLMPGSVKTLNESNMSFNVVIDDFTSATILTDLNTMNIHVQVKHNNNNMSECIVGINGEFNETHGKYPDAEIRNKISNWFFTLSTTEPTKDEPTTDETPTAEKPEVETVVPDQVIEP